MNIYQRAVLIIGAALLLAALATSPRVMYGSHGIIIDDDARHLYEEMMPGMATVVDLETAAVRAIAVVAPMILLWWALDGIGGKKRSA